MAKQTSRDTELSKREPIREKLLEVFQGVLKGFTEQADRNNATLDHWDAFKLKLGEKQFYSGNSRLYLPFVHDAVEARKTRFTNQIFPQSQRYVEVTTEDGEIPHATMALLEHYVRWNNLRSRVVRPLMVNGDIEGQYSLYVSWKETKRYSGRKIKSPVEVGGLPAGTVDDVDDFEEEVITDAGPWVDVLHDSDLLVLPVTADSIEDAVRMGGSVTIMRRWSKAAIKNMIAEGEFVKEAGESLLTAMNSASGGVKRPNVSKEVAEAAGIKDKGKHVLGYETWVTLKVDGEHRICRAYYGGDNVILGCKLNPYWCDRVPVISGSVEKDGGVFKGRAPVADVLDLQILANDTINEGADTAHFAAMPIIMTDPEKNPRVGSMVLGLAAIWETAPGDTQFAKFPELWKDAFARAEGIKQQMFQTLGVNPSMLPQGAGSRKKNQAEVAIEQQVDVLTTADAVTVIEEEILSPLLERFADYDHQFRNDALTIRVFGPIGQKAIMQDVEPQQSGKRYAFRWFGVEAARNAAQFQQQIAGLNVFKEIPPQLYAGYKLDVAPLLQQMAENLFGPRLAPLIFKKVDEPGVDAETENDMLQHGFPVVVHPGDDDQEHLQSHMALMQAGGDPHGVVRKHVQDHQQQLMAKAQQAQQAQQGGAPGGGPPGTARGLAPGAQPGTPNNGKGPPGMIPQDQMARAGAPVMPRRPG